MVAGDVKLRLGPNPEASVRALRQLGLSENEIARYFATTCGELARLVSRTTESRDTPAKDMESSLWDTHQSPTSHTPPSKLSNG